MDVFKNSYLVLLLLHLLATSYMALVVSSAIDPFSDALLSLKSELVDDTNSLGDWSIPSGQNPSQETTILACSWSGVICDKNSTMVIGLDLSMKKLGGRLSGRQFSLFTDLVELNLSDNSLSENLPIQIFNLTNLRTLDISMNNFSGNFPNGSSNMHHLVVLDAFSNSFSGSLPAEVSQIETLKVLNLAGSYFSGSIPSQYGSFKKLEYIHLAGNSLTGKIPPELGQLSMVTHMEIGYNSYEGSIPWQMGNMREIQYLDIAGANLSGSIPNEFGNLTKLKSLFLFRNQFTGFVPAELSNISTLIDLDLSDNQLSGSIPERFSELKNLKLLSLMCNNMGGIFPEGIALLPSLESLLIWNNFFHGSIPESLGRSSKLKWVDISTNNFTGSIPPDICSNGSLLKLILFSNNFSGEISDSLANCSSLVRVRFENNRFSGDISFNFINLPNLTYIDISRNSFTGGIPLDLSNASTLQYFNVSNNPLLEGSLPENIFSLPFLQNFSAFSCGIKGKIPPFNSCESLSIIELNSNHLSGSITETISHCQVLETINLSSNNLTGHLPEEFASLPVLSVLDLSHNQLNGQIPNKFINSSNLKLLNLSFNQISGSVPLRFRTMDVNAFIGNAALCGEPLQSCPTETRLEKGIRRTQNLAWVLIVCACVVLFITATLFGLLYLRRRVNSKWKMVSFNGIPQLTPNEILKSFNSAVSCKAVLPTGITVLVKRMMIKWDAKETMEFITRLGNARHKNLTSLLGVCYNENTAYILYDYSPDGNLAEKLSMKTSWPTKYKIIVGIAKGLVFLHHDCSPPIPHGGLKTVNIVFDENMEPRLAETGFKFLSMTDTGKETGKEELYMDIYNFGQMILEVLTNGNAKHDEVSKPTEALLREIYLENGVVSSKSSIAFQEEIKLVLEAALLCTQNRPSMKDVLQLLVSGLKP
ncbi:leucine-rich repeat receptor-like protein kinase TDR [Impatiens glandulifera]|uniref:leucine-rich repeat receptor-like protein kinase TDR n=1 Tax=Impatiens glandulifera TaxID=253017 RepID=UPI001FB0C954|nr:leucine-rich repeat receptor-like protein kinase TDR [Impatiens glandulifera]